MFLCLSGAFLLAHTVLLHSGFHEQYAGCAGHLAVLRVLLPSGRMFTTASSAALIHTIM